MLIPAAVFSYAEIQLIGADMEISLIEGFTRASNIRRTWSDLVEFDGSINQVLFKAEDNIELEMRLCPIEGSKHKNCFKFFGIVDGPSGAWIAK